MVCDARGASPNGPVYSTAPVTAKHPVVKFHKMNLSIKGLWIDGNNRYRFTDSVLTFSLNSWRSYSHMFTRIILRFISLRKTIHCYRCLFDPMATLYIYQGISITWPGDRLFMVFVFSQLHWMLKWFIVQALCNYFAMISLLCRLFVCKYSI